MISPTQRPLPDNTQYSQQTDIHTPSGFEPTIPATARPQTYALNCASIVIGLISLSVGHTDITRVSVIQISLEYRSFRYDLVSVIKISLIIGHPDITRESVIPISLEKSVIQMSLNIGHSVSLSVGHQDVT